jgi:transcriptional regulator GlxA family with amidase domain
MPESEDRTQPAVRNRKPGSNGNGAVARGTAIADADEVPLVLRERRLKKVLEIMESRLPHSVREMAMEVHLTPTHLQRLFKQETGVHIGQLLTERRLHKAAELLSTTDMEIKEIAYYVGYGHHSSFVRAFQRRFRQSPKQYRQDRVA